jgi:hypothetical protein
MGIPLSQSQPNPTQTYLKYRVDSAKKFNQVILEDRLEYWFSKAPQGFWKFIEPCGHNDYRIGDSWAEELGINFRAFKESFLKIGVHYTSKRLFNENSNPFQGHKYLSYFD